MKPSASATPLATLDLPAPAGPSIAITIAAGLAPQESPPRRKPGVAGDRLGSRSGWSRSLKRRSPSRISGPPRSRLKHSASIRRPSSSGRPQPRSAASRSVLIAGWGSSAISSASSSARSRQVPLGDDLVDEADLERLGGVDHAAGDDQLHGPPPADDPRQPLGAAVGEADVPAAAGDAEVACSSATARWHQQTHSSPPA